MDFFKKYRLVTLLACTVLAAASASFFTMFHMEKTLLHEKLADEGKLLSQLLKSVPYRDTPLSGMLSKYLQAVPGIKEYSNFCYIIVKDKTGLEVSKLVKPGTVLPISETVTPSLKPLKLTVKEPGTGQRIKEYHVPIFADESLAGTVILGLAEPVGILKPSSHKYYLILLSIPLLLGIVLLLLYRSEIKGIRVLRSQLEEIKPDENDEQNVTLDVSGNKEIAGLTLDLKILLDSFLKRIRKLEETHINLLTADKVYSYKKTRLEAILEKMPDGILVIDDTSMATYVNSATETLLGIDRETILAKKFQEWSDEKISTFLTRYQGHNGRLYRAEGIEINPSHTPEKTISMDAFPLVTQGSEQAPQGTLIICRDVTSHALARQARGDFVAHVAHELKSPLTVLSMYSEMLLGEDGKSEDFRIEAVNIVHDEVERLHMLINSLLSISKIEMGSIAIDRSRVKLIDLLEDAFATVSRSGKNNDLNFKLELPDELSSVFIDKDMVRVSINNLLTNAIKYNRPGGSVSLTAEETDESVFIRVEDTGFGIPPESLDKVFEKFYRVDNENTREQSGHGLGLTLAKNIIDLHHGKLTVESTLDKGTTFTILFNKKDGLIREGI